MCSQQICEMTRDLLYLVGVHGWLLNGFGRICGDD